jgi:hypothetical protein
MRGRLSRSAARIGDSGADAPRAGGVEAALGYRSAALSRERRSGLPVADLHARHGREAGRREEASMRIWKAALASVGIAMAAGTVLGTVRELVLREWLSNEWALALETPLMIAVCGYAVHWAIRRFEVPERVTARLQMGAAVLLLQVTAEDLLTRVLRGGSVFEHWASYSPAALAITVFGLAAFAVLPVLLLRVHVPASA